MNTSKKQNTGKSVQDRFPGIYCNKGPSSKSVADAASTFEVTPDTAMPNSFMSNCATDISAGSKLSSMMHFGADLRVAVRSFCSARNMLELALFAAFMLGLLALLVHNAASIEYFWQWYRLEQVFLVDNSGSFWGGHLWQGLLLTLQISAASLFFALLLALLTTQARLFGGVVERALASGYVQVIRNTPLMVQILFIYFVIAPGFKVEAVPCAIVAISLFEGAYISEIFRAGVLSVPVGQWEAAQSLGLSRYTSFTSVVLPQATRKVLPPLLSQSVSLVKDSSLASVISVAELTQMGNIAVSGSFMSLEIWLSVALVYLLVSLFLSFIALLLRVYFTGSRQ